MPICSPGLGVEAGPVQQDDRAALLVALDQVMDPAALDLGPAGLVLDHIASFSVHRGLGHSQRKPNSVAMATKYLLVLAPAKIRQESSQRKVKLQKQPGHWSAFWLFNNSVGKIGDQGRDGSEIDIMEKPWLDDRINHAIHWDGYGKEHRSTGKVSHVQNVMEGFHTFSLLWTPTEYVFYVDGKETWRTKAGGVCQVPLYIKLSDEVGDWAGDIKKVKLPDEFLVDYVRVYDIEKK